MKKLLISLLLITSLTANASELQTIKIQEGFFEKTWNKISECKLNIFCYFRENLGSTLSTITGTETVSYALKTTTNNNFTALNNDKMENSTTSVNSITTLNNLSSVGTLTTGDWNATAIPVNKGGTGTTSPSTYQVILGNGANGLTVASSTGTTGQFLTSNGANAYPSWQTSAVDTGINYTWSGLHTFNGATTTISSATTTFSGTNPVVGIGTTTPTLKQSGDLSVSGDGYFAGGLGVGMLQTTNGNLSVSGTASTTNLVVSSVCTGCPKTIGILSAGATTTANRIGQSNSGVNTTSASYVVAKTITTYLQGSVTAEFECQDSNDNTDNKNRLYVNDVAVGTEQTCQTASVSFFSQTLYVSPGDRIQLMHHTGSSGTKTSQNFRLYGNYSETNNFTDTP